MTGIFRRSTQAIDGMVHMCSIGVFVAVHCSFSVIGCNFLHANALPVSIVNDTPLGRRNAWSMAQRINH